MSVFAADLVVSPADIIRDMERMAEEAPGCEETAAQSRALCRLLLRTPGTTAEDAVAVAVAGLAHNIATTALELALAPQTRREDLIRAVALTAGLVRLTAQTLGGATGAPLPSSTGRSPENG